jgi:hypothetical protein
MDTYMKLSNEHVRKSKAHGCEEPPVKDGSAAWLIILQNVLLSQLQLRLFMNHSDTEASQLG